MIPFFCARDRARTCTSLRTLVPETSASTNSATWANAVQIYNFFCYAKKLLDKCIIQKTNA